MIRRLLPARRLRGQLLFMEAVPLLNMLVAVMVVQGVIPVLPSRRWLPLVKLRQLILALLLM